MNKRRMTLVAAVVSAVGPLIALPAASQAKSLDRTVVTDGPSPAGLGKLEYRGNGFRLSACDLDRDGYGVRAYAVAGPAKSNLLRPRVRAVAVSKQGNGTCSTRPASIEAKAGWTVAVWVCVRDHDGDRGGGRKDQHCGRFGTTKVPKRRG